MELSALCLLHGLSWHISHLWNDPIGLFVTRMVGGWWSIWPLSGAILCVPWSISWKDKRSAIARWKHPSERCCQHLTSSLPHTTTWIPTAVGDSKIHLSYARRHVRIGMRVTTNSQDLFGWALKSNKAKDPLALSTFRGDDVTSDQCSICLMSCITHRPLLPTRLIQTCLFCSTSLVIVVAIASRASSHFILNLLSS